MTTGATTTGATTTGATARAVVVGGGISGLCTAYDLGRAGWQVELHEAGDRFGGKIHSSPVGDRQVDAGPDSFLARVEAGKQLCRDLGIFDEVTSPVAPVPAYLVRDGQLHELPARSMLGVPTDLDALAATGLISPAGIEAARNDLTAAATPVGDDISVGALCRARLGDEITDRLIDPILGGINASDIDRLSLRAGAPLLAAALERGPSLIEGLRALRPATGAALGSQTETEPVFHGLPGGIVRIIEALVASMPHTVTLHRNSPVRSLDDLGPADATVVAVPAFAATDLVRPLSPTAADELASIDYASVAQVVVEVPTGNVAFESDASGMLFPRVDGTLLTACTWFSTKWAHYQREGTVLLRLSSGRFGDDRVAGLDDDELITVLLDELSQIDKVTGDPIASRVMRWNQALPQYTPGHRNRVERIFDAVEADAPNLHLTGAAYAGIGIPACIEHGRGMAQAILDGHR